MFNKRLKCSLSMKWDTILSFEKWYEVSTWKNVHKMVLSKQDAKQYTQYNLVFVKYICMYKKMSRRLYTKNAIVII